MRYLTYLIISSLLGGATLTGCSSGRSAFNRGEDLESDGKFEEAMYSYADAFRKDPEAGEYRVRFFRAREKAADARYRQGNKLYEQGDYAAALTEFRAGLGIDPTQGRFGQLVERTGRLVEARQAYQEGLEFEKANKFKDANRAFTRAVELNPDRNEYQAAQARVLGLRKSKLNGFELSLKSAKPITLKFRDARIKDVFHIVTQLSGINFIFDEGVKDQPVTIYLENATFQQVLDLLTNMSKLGRKIANERTVIIYPKTPEKTKQYEDMTVRTFNLNHLEAKKAVNLIRTLLQVRKIYVNEETNAIVVRDTADVVDVVEKILEANDVPDAEVILDVEVLEISDTDSKTVGLLLSPYNVQMGAFNSSGQIMASTLKSATTTSTSGTVTTSTTADVANLIRAFALKGYTGFVTVPTGQYNFAKTLGKAEVLSNPKIRVKNREKSKFIVGKRLPITTTSTTGTTGGYSVNVQYVDVGVKVNAEPNIQPDNEIVIKLGLEVSQDTDKQTVGGSDSATTVVTIATRNLETVLSLKDGETSVIGGLIERNKSNNKNKIFLLSDIPLLGELLTNTDSSNRKSELLLAITPRLVRGVTVPQADLASFVSGKEDDPALGRTLASFDQEPLFEAEQKRRALPEQPLSQPPVVPVPVQPPLPAPSALPRPLPPGPAVLPQPLNQPAVPQTAAPSASSPQATTQQGVTRADAAPQSPVKTEPSQSKATAAAVQRGFLRIAAPVSASAGQLFTLEVKAMSIGDLRGAPFELSFDPAFVEFVSAAEGGFLRSDGETTIFGTSVSPATGSVTINLSRAQAKSGISGGGTLASLQFRAKQKGMASFGFRNISFCSSDGSPLSVTPFSAAVEIK